jgi:hypothetical protein
MALRQTGNPILGQTSTSANFRVTNGPGMVTGNGQISVPLMEENLAREMARMKMDKEKQNRQVEKICAESPELRELQNKIKSAYLNKERASQVTETQYRKQVEVVSFYHLKFIWLMPFIKYC